MTLVARVVVGLTGVVGRARHHATARHGIPLSLRIRAALTLPPISERVAAARAALAGHAVLFNVDVSTHCGVITSKGDEFIHLGYCTFDDDAV